MPSLSIVSVDHNDLLCSYIINSVSPASVVNVSELPLFNFTGDKDETVVKSIHSISAPKH